MTPGAEAARVNAPRFLAERVPLYQQRIEGVLARTLEIEGGATARLLEAMRYSTLGGGKRVRPVLVYATGEALGATLEQLDAWLELAELVSDEGFLAQYRAKATTASVPPLGVRQAQEEALRAIQTGVAPENPSARPIVRRWVSGLARQQGRKDERAFAMELLRASDAGRFEKEQRFWTLLAILRPEMAKHPAYTVGPWLLRAARTWVADGS